MIVNYAVKGADYSTLIEVTLRNFVKFGQIKGVVK
jgi:hypothetical protein